MRLQTLPLTCEQVRVAHEAVGLQPCQQRVEVVAIKRRALDRGVASVVGKLGGAG